MRIRVAVVGLSICGGVALLEAEDTKVVLTSNAECTLSVDGQPVEGLKGSLKPGNTYSFTVAPGEHLFSADCVGAKPWKRVVTVGREQKVVEIETTPATPEAASSPRSTPRPSERRMPETLQDLEGRWRGDFTDGWSYQGCSFLLKRVAADRYTIAGGCPVKLVGGGEWPQGGLYTLDTMSATIKGETLSWKLVAAVIPRGQKNEIKYTECTANLVNGALTGMCEARSTKLRFVPE